MKNKWKYLKDNYRKELKKGRQRSSGDAGGSVVTSKWPYFESLNFLRDEVNQSDRKRNSNRKFARPADPEKILGQLESNKLLPLLNEDHVGVFIKTEEYIDDSSNPQTDVQVLTPAATTTQETTSLKRRGTTNEISGEKVLLLEEQNIDILKSENNSKETHCEDYHFFMSLKPYLKKMDDLQKLRLRNKITQAVMEELQYKSGSSSSDSFWVTQPQHY